MSVTASSVPAVSSPYKWKSKLSAYDEAIEYIRGRRNGTVTSLKCASPKINDAFADGFEWGTAVCFAARPGGGKSLLKEQLIKEFFELNLVDFRVLDYDLEMIPRVTALRELSSYLEKSYKYLLSADKTDRIKKEEFEKLKDYVESKKNFRDTNKERPIDLIENAPTVEEFIEDVISYMEVHKKADGTYTKLVVTIDHARLFLKNGMKETDMLQALGTAIIKLKKMFNDSIIFIVFNHLNRKVLEPSRCEPGKIGNYITDDDILGSDAFCQSMDVVIAMDRPAKRKIDKYGPEMYIISDPNMLIFHFLKVRNGDTRISFFIGEFSKMRIVEMLDQPATARKLNDVKS